MFGHDSQPTIMWRYGALAPIQGMETVREQMRLAHKYYNKLVEIELKRRGELEETVRRLSPDLDRLTKDYERLGEEIEAARIAMKAANAKERRKRGSPEERAALKELRAKRRETYAALKEAKAAAYKSAEAKKETSEVNQRASRERRAARAASGLYWGTYLAMEQSIPSNGRPPKFHRWTGEGRLAVEIQHGISADDVMACGDSRLRIEPPEDPSGTRRQRRTRAYMRVQSDGRQPVWAVLPIVMHRPLPEGSRVKWAYLHCRKTANRERWSLTLALAKTDGWAKTDTASSGALGVDLGWRLLDHGLRVGFAVGDDGRETELLLPIKDVKRWEKAASLRRVRDHRLNEILGFLSPWIAAREGPDWLIERTATIAKWRSHARLASLVMFWRDNRFDGDADMFSLAEKWLHKDRHLWQWEANQRRKAIAWRTDLYRRWAAMFSREYRTVRLEDMNLHKMARRPEPDEDDDTRGAPMRVIASCGDLRRMFIERFAAHELVDAADTTRRCAKCGEMTEADPVPAVHVTCQGCGAVLDQDRNAAIWLLRGGARAEAMAEA